MEQQYLLVQNGDIFEKYLVTYDRLELINLKKEIIAKCSTIYHKTSVLSFSPLKYQFMYGENRNAVQLDAASIPTKNANLPQAYRYTYDYYAYPSIVPIIDKILNGNMQSLLYVKFEEKVDYEKIVAYKNEKINNLTDENNRERRKMLKELEDLILMAQYNKNQKGTVFFKEQFTKIFTKQLVDTIALKDIHHTLDFFNADISSLNLYFHRATKDILYYEPRKRGKK